MGPDKKYYFLLEWENDEDFHQYGVVHSSQIVQTNGDLFCGKLVTVNFNGAIRRAKIIKISDDIEQLQQCILKMEYNTMNSSSMDDTTMPPLDVTIQRLKQILRQRKSTPSSRQSPVAQFVPEDSINNYNVSLRPSTSRKSPDIIVTKSKNSRRILEDSQMNDSIENPLFSEFSQLQEDLSKAQMQYLEINHYVDNLKEKVDFVSQRIKQWQVGTGCTDLLNMSEIHAPVDDEDVSMNQSLRDSNRMAPQFDENSSGDENDMVNIGSGRTKVPRHVMNQIDWRSHTIATRKLLMAIFPRKILATHSLTGKSSPAFTNKPAKLCLDPVNVRDIVITVSDRCKVNPSLVRSAITTKCADENKMYRTREAKKQKKKKNGNQENEPPAQPPQTRPQIQINDIRTKTEMM